MIHVQKNENRFWQENSAIDSNLETGHVFKETVTYLASSNVSRWGLGEGPTFIPDDLVPTVRKSTGSTVDKLAQVKLKNNTL